MSLSDAQREALDRARAARAGRGGMLPRPLRPEAEVAAAALHSAIAARPPWTTPCIAAADPAPWTSEDPAEAEWAAAECEACPLLDLCAQFGVESRAEGVVLAGRRWFGGTHKQITQTTSAPAGVNTNRNTAWSPTTTRASASSSRPPPARPKSTPSVRGTPPTAPRRCSTGAAGWSPRPGWARSPPRRERLMNTNKEREMNTNETPEPLPMALFGVDNDPARVERLERQIGHLRAEVAALRLAAQYRRMQDEEGER